jgi:hypothetical protein
VRQHVHDEIHQERAAPRNLLGLPSLLHGTPEADRHRGRVERFSKKFGAQTSEQRKVAEKAAKAAKAAATKKAKPTSSATT